MAAVVKSPALGAGNACDLVDEVLVKGCSHQVYSVMYFVFAFWGLPNPTLVPGVRGDRQGCFPRRGGGNRLYAVAIFLTNPRRLVSIVRYLACLLNQVLFRDSARFSARKMLGYVVF